MRKYILKVGELRVNFEPEGVKLEAGREEDAREMVRIAQGSNYPLAWAGYIFLAAVKNLKG